MIAEGGGSNHPVPYPPPYPHLGHDDPICADLSCRRRSNVSQPTLFHYTSVTIGEVAHQVLPYINLHPLTVNSNTTTATARLIVKITKRKIGGVCGGWWCWQWVCLFDDGIEGASIYKNEMQEGIQLILLENELHFSNKTPD